MPAPENNAVEFRLPLSGPMAELTLQVLREAIAAGGIVEGIRTAVESNLAQRGLLNKDQAARFLGIEESALQVWIRAKGDRGGRGVPHLKIGETVRFRLESLEAWAAQFEVNKVLPAAA